MQTKEKIKLGEILVQQKILTPLIVERIIRIANTTHRRFGQTLEDLGLITGEEIAQALAIQLDHKIVTDICRFTVPQEALRLVTVETAFENRVFPLGIQDGSLALAMSDPTNTDIVGTLAASSKLRVVPFITTTQDIMKAISKYYLGELLKSYSNSILVVETNPQVRETVVSPLTKEGYEVVEAVDATDGFQQALLHLPNLVLTAKEMPDGDAYAFFTTLQGVAETRRIPFILLSQRANEAEEAMAFKRGFFDYIPMPARDITLVSRVRRALAVGKSYAPHSPKALQPEDRPAWLA
jgi:CheY-like chemotaxis protein